MELAFTGCFWLFSCTFASGPVPPMDKEGWMSRLYNTATFTSSPHIGAISTW